MKKCPKCGTEYPDTHEFCTICGNRLVDEKAADDGETTPLPSDEQETTPLQPDAEETTPLSSDAAEDDTIPTDQLTPVTVSADPKSTPASMPRIATEAVARPVVSPDEEEHEKERKGGRKKEHHPGRIIAGIAAVLVLAAALGGTGYLGWSYIQKQDQEIADLKAQVKELEEKNSSSNESSSSSGSSDSGTASSASGTSSSANTGTGSATVSDSGSTTSGYTAYASYVGTWTGTLQSDEGYSLYTTPHKCYGASDKPLVLEFKSIADSGQATVVAHVLYHGHKTDDLSNDAASSDGDSYLTTGDITTTFDPKYSFSFSYTPSGAGTEVDVKITPVRSQSDNATQFEVEVTSYYGGDRQFTDTYTITKSAA